MLASSLFLFLELERYRIYAETLTRRRWAVIEHVPKVSATLLTGYLSSAHSEAVIHIFFNTIFRNGFPETGPACARIKFCVWAKQLVSAGSAYVSACFLVFQKLSCECGFCSLLSKHMIFFLRKSFLPILFCFGRFWFDGFLPPWIFKILKTELLPLRIG